MQNREQFETMMKSVLNENVKNILPSDDMIFKIKAVLESAKSEGIKTKSGFRPARLNAGKVLAAAMCLSLLLAGTVFAADYISKYAKGFLTEKEYVTPPSKAEIQKDAGFAAKMPESLPGGFKLESSSLSGYIDGSTEVVKDEKRKLVSAMYKRPDAGQFSYITLSASNDGTETIPADSARTVSVNGSDAKYWEYTLHVVPHGYEPSEDEAEKEKTGELVTVYVSGKNENAAKIEEKSLSVKALMWKDIGVYYVLRDTGCGSSADELVKMAETVMSTK